MARAKRDHNTGSVIPRKADLTARVMLGYKTNKQGRTVPNRRIVHASSKGELNRKVIAAQQHHLENLNPAPKILTVKELCTLWKAEKEKSGTEANTNDNYDSIVCLLYTSPSPRDGLLSRMPSSA